MKHNLILTLFLLVLIPIFAVGAWYPFNPKTGDMQTDGLSAFRAQQCHVAHYRWPSPDTAAVDAVCDVTPTVGVARLVTGATLTQPDVCRGLTVKAPSSYSGVVDVTGTNLAGVVITEAFTLSGTNTTTGVKAFRTVTAVEVPAGEQIQVGTSDKLGLPYRSAFATVFSAWLDGTLEGTPPTVVRDTDELEKNTIDLNSALNNKQVDLFFTWY
jgi:hypothetical protein